MLKHREMTMAVELVSPAIASKWLQQNRNNRRVRDKVVDQYANDMLQGYWFFKPVAICFDEMGNLGNGQHTLNAIIRSGQAQDLLVARNVAREAIAAMDRGVTRTLNDVANFIGADFDGRRASIARVIRWGPKTSTGQSFNELMDAYLEHAEHIDFVCNNAPRTAGLNATALAVCAKALYTNDKNRIRRFIELLHTGMSAGDYESAAIRLRDYARSQRGSSTTVLRAEMYNKTMSALAHFLEGKPMSRLYGTDDDLFPVAKLKAAA